MPFRPARLSESLIRLQALMSFGHLILNFCREKGKNPFNLGKNLVGELINSLSNVIRLVTCCHWFCMNSVIFISNNGNFSLTYKTFVFLRELRPFTAMKV